MDGPESVALQHVSIANAMSRFVDGSRHIPLAADDAASLLSGIPSNLDPHEDALKTRLIEALGRYANNMPPPAHLWRYRYWDPIYVPKLIAPSTPGSERYAAVPLGIVCSGIAEIINPSSVVHNDLGPGAPIARRLANPAGRKLEERDRIDGLLFPGSPIGLFEATDLIYERSTSSRLVPEHRAYALFSGTRSIEACISAERNDTVEKWLQHRRREEPSGLDRVARNLGLPPEFVGKPLFDKLKGAIRKGNSRARPEALLRLLFTEMFPTPWSTMILYFSKEFFDGLTEELRWLIAGIAWKRMSATCERVAIASRDHSGVEFTAAVIMSWAEDAATGNGHCLVPANQCPEVLENTDFEALHARYCSLSEDIYPKGTPVFVPGYLRKPGDWGLLCLKWYKPDTMKKAQIDSLYHEISERVESLSAERSAGYKVFYVGHPAHVNEAALPENVRTVFEHETKARKSRHKFLMPSIRVVRIA